MQKVLTPRLGRSRDGRSDPRERSGVEVFRKGGSPSGQKAEVPNRCLGQSENTTLFYARIHLKLQCNERAGHSQLSKTSETPALTFGARDTRAASGPGVAETVTPVFIFYTLFVLRIGHKTLQHVQKVSCV